MAKKKFTDVFKAIADPTRRHILHLLMITNALTIQDIYTRFDSSRQAVTKHIRILSDAGLINIVLQGRERICYLQGARLNEVYEWVKFYERFWDEKFISLENYLNKDQA
jgi:DNA-binding transcriptional ArsR family regulator